LFNEVLLAIALLGATASGATPNRRPLRQAGELDLRAVLCAACKVDAGAAESAVEVRRGKRIVTNCVSGFTERSHLLWKRRSRRGVAHGVLPTRGRTPWCSAASSIVELGRETPFGASPLTSALRDRHSLRPAAAFPL